MYTIYPYSWSYKSQTSDIGYQQQLRNHTPTPRPPSTTACVSVTSESFSYNPPVTKTGQFVTVTLDAPLPSGPGTSFYNTQSLSQVTVKSLIPAQMPPCVTRPGYYDVT